MILPAKPAPRKSRSVMMQEHPDQDMDQSLMRKANRRQVDTGVFDELNRMDQINKSFNTVSTPMNQKAMKNASIEVTALIENKPGQNFSQKRAAEDSNLFMTLNLQKRKPIFKNYIQNNASILRKEAQMGKLKKLQDEESHQASYLDKMSGVAGKISTTRSSAMDRNTRMGPMHTINSLMKHTTNVFEPAKSSV